MRLEICRNSIVYIALCWALIPQWSFAQQQQTPPPYYQEFVPANEEFYPAAPYRDNDAQYRLPYDYPGQDIQADNPYAPYSSEVYTPYEEWRYQDDAPSRQQPPPSSQDEDLAPDGFNKPFFD